MYEDSANDNSKSTSYDYAKTDLCEEDVESYSFSELYHERKCKKHARDSNKPLFMPEMWALMRYTFAQLAEPGVQFA